MNARDPLVPRRRVGLREDERVVGDRRVRDPVLLAVQDVDVALAARGRAHRRDVRAGARLGQPEAGELLALRLRRRASAASAPRCRTQQRERVQPDVDRDQRPERRLAALDLLAGERLGDEVEPGAAVLLGDHDAEDPELGHALDQLEVELVVDVVLDRDREDPLVDEGADGLLDQALLVGELEVHRRSLAGRTSGHCVGYDGNENCGYPPKAVDDSPRTVTGRRQLRVDTQRVRFSAAGAYLGVGVLAIAAYTANGATNTGIYDGIGLASAGVIIIAAFYYRPANFLGWILIGASQLLFAARRHRLQHRAEQRFPERLGRDLPRRVTPSGSSGSSRSSSSEFPHLDLGSHIDAAVVALAVGVSLWAVFIDERGMSGAGLGQAVTWAYPACRSADSHAPDPRGVPAWPADALVLAARCRRDPARRCGRRLRDPGRQQTPTPGTTGPTRAGSSPTSRSRPPRSTRRCAG